MKPICVYHHPCADGFGAAWVFHHKFGDGVELVPGQYQKEPPAFENRKIFLTDFSYKRPVVEALKAKGNDLVLIDHHKSALEDLEGVLPMDHCSLHHSGAMLAWKFCFPDREPPQLLRHIEDRDLWKFELPGTREIQAALFSYEYDLAVWDTLMLQTPLQKLYDEGVALERKHFKDIRELLKITQGRMAIGGLTMPVANVPYTLSSDACQELMKQHGTEAAACYWDTAEGRSFSLRSAKDGTVDVSEIAKLYGGGGHKNAAGFSVDNGHLLSHVRLV